jgi:hypothetical protein
MLFHNIVVEGKNDFLNLSVLTPKGEKSEAFLKDIEFNTDRKTLLPCVTYRNVGQV